MVRLRSLGRLALTWFAVAGLLALAGPAARAQSAQPDADGLAAARAFVTTMGMSEQMAAVLPLIFNQLKQVMKSQNPAQGPALDEAIALMTDKLSGRTAEVIDEIAQLYAQQIPTDDLKAMTAFFSTPAGKRFVAMQPQLTQQQMEIGRRWGERVAIDAQREMQTYMRQHGFKQ